MDESRGLFFAFFPGMFKSILVIFSLLSVPLIAEESSPFRLLAKNDQGACLALAKLTVKADPTEMYDVALNEWTKRLLQLRNHTRWILGFRQIINLKMTEFFDVTQGPYADNPTNMTSWHCELRARNAAVRPWPADS